MIAEEEQLGVMPTHEALRLAEERGLDLVEISPRAFPPVCRIMDYGKYKYEEAKKKQQARKRASTVETKEIKFRPKTEEHDMAFKVKHVRRFLEGGNKVRLAVVFRGREITHPQTGMAVLNKVVDKLGLADDPDFNGAAGDGGFVALARSLILRSDGGAAADAGQRHALAASHLADTLTTGRGSGPAAIAITASTSDGEKSALIANTVAQAFLDTVAAMQPVSPAPIMDGPSIPTAP